MAGNIDEKQEAVYIGNSPPPAVALRTWKSELAIGSSPSRFCRSELIDAMGADCRSQMNFPNELNRVSLSN
jgi:hypothetical protein